MFRLPFFLFIFFPVFASAQESGGAYDPYLDSLFQVLRKDLHDTARVNTMVLIASSLKEEEPDKAIVEAKQALELAQKIKYKKGIAKSYFMLGNAYDNLEKFSDALDSYFKGLSYAEQVNDQYVLEATLNQIGIIYSYQKNYKMALKYFLKFTNIAKKNPNKIRLATGYNNLGICYKNLKDYKTAEKYYHMALDIFLKKKHQKGITSSYANLGVIANQQKQNDRAMFYFNKTMDIARMQGDYFAMAIATMNIGEMYYTTGDYKKALMYYDSSVNYAGKKGYNQLKDAYDGMYKTYEAMGKYADAYKYLKLYLAAKDSVFGEETSAKLNLAEKNYLADKAEREYEAERQKAAQEKLKDQHARTINRIVIFALCIIVVFIAFIAYTLLKRFNEKKKANTLLQQQRDEIAHQKKEITDSINYAQRIQQAILPPERILQKYFSEYFIIYKPKDIVSGDFYWYTWHKNRLIVAVADCTGHGVPGGFMSMIGSDKLNHAVLENNLMRPCDILSLINKGVKQALNQNEADTSSRDGMDMALCSFDFTENKLEYAGANRPLWLLRNKELTEYKATKNAIGGFTDDEVLFQNNVIDIQKGDALYMFSDGFVDQFGGPDEKKITSKKLRELILSVSDKSMKAQGAALNQFFTDWKSSFDQMDDVLVMGVKI